VSLGAFERFHHCLLVRRLAVSGAGKVTPAAMINQINFDNSII
jgi:hypothetical protein